MHTRQSRTACKSGRRPTRPQRMRAQGPAALTFAASLSVGALSPAFAGPTGGVVVEGQGTISNPAAGQTRIDQASSQLHLNWATFDVAANESVQFNQPSSSSVAFNRILDQNPSQIFGTIQANGQVVLVNPNGLLIGRTAQINVGSLVASSLDAIDFDATTGRYRFSSSRSAPGGVFNEGTITAGSGGSVTLLGGRVSNTGTIVADLGSVNLAAGRTATLDLAGDGLLRLEVGSDLLANADGAADAVNNSGTVQANGGQVLLTAAAVQDVFTNLVNNTGVVQAGRIDNSGGTIRLVGAGGAVRSSGTLDASAGDSASTGGSVAVLGDRVGLFGAAVVDVSGATGGGQALIGGDFQGKNPEVLNASQTYVSVNANINADAGASGDGGRIIVWADEVTRFDGNLSSRGGALSGNGGFAEVSGKKTLVFTGGADLRAAHGTSGTLLLDPDDIIITDSDDAPAAAIDDGTWELAADTGAPATIGNETIETLLQTGLVTLQAANTIVQNADADINGAPATNGLTLEAGGAITLNGDIALNGGTLTVTSDTGNVTLAGTYSVGDALVEATTGAISVATVTASGDVTLTAGGAITESGASAISATNLSLSASTGIGSAGNALGTTVDTLTAITPGGGVYIDETNSLTLTNVNAGAGDVEVTSTTGNITATSVIATGDIELTASGGGIAVGTISADGVTLNANGGAITEAGTSSISATNATLSANAAIGSPGGRIGTTVTTLTANASGGGVYVDETNGLTLTNVTASAGNTVEVTSTTGNITATNVGATGGTVSLTTSDGGIAVGTVSAGTVTLNAGGGSITESGGASSITATNATLLADDGIGTLANRIATNVTTLAATASGGGVFIEELNGIALTNVSASAGNTVNVISAAGDITANSVSATNGSVSLTATAGGIGVNTISAANVTLNAGVGSITEIGTSSITATNATLLASNAIGTTADRLGTDVTSLTATAGNGGVYIAEQDAITLTNVSASVGNDVEVTTTSGSLTATSVSALGGDVRLTSGGGIVLGAVAAADVTLTANGGSITETGVSSITANSASLLASNGIGTAANRIGTDVASLEANANNGNVYIDEANGLTLTNVSAFGGNDVEVTTATGNITASNVSAAGGAVTLRAQTGAIAVGTIVASDVTVVANAGSITESGASMIVADTLQLQAIGGGIGLSGAGIGTQVTSFEASTNSGGVYIDETNGLTLTSVVAGGGAIEVTSASGNITVGMLNATDAVRLDAAGGSILDDGNDATEIIAPNGITLEALNGLGDVDFATLGGSSLDVNTGGPLIATVASNTGEINLRINGSPTVGSGGITLGDDLASGRGGSIILQSPGAALGMLGYASDAIHIGSGNTTQLALLGDTIVLPASGGFTDQPVDTLVVRATTDVIKSIGPPREYSFAANNLRFESGSAGGATTLLTNATTLDAVVGNNQDLTITETDGVTLGTVSAGSGNVTIVAGGAITDDGSNATRVTGNAVVLTGTSVGAPGNELETSATTLNATASAGGIALRELDAVTLTASATGGAVDVQTGNGVLTVASATGDGVTLASGGAGNNLVLNGNVAGGAGGVTLTAGSGGIGGNIVGAGAVSGSSLTATGASIGTSGARLSTNVASLNATSSGDLFVTNTGPSLSLTAIAGGEVDVEATAGTLTASLVSGNGVTLSTVGDNNALSVTGPLTGGTDDVLLTTSGAGSDISLSGAVSSGGGNISLIAAGAGSDINLASAIGTSGNVTLAAGSVANRGAIVTSGGNQVTANSLSAVGTSIGTDSFALRTNVDSVDATSTNGQIRISEISGASVTASATGGAVEVVAGGSLAVAAASGTSVNLSSTDNLTVSGPVDATTGGVGLVAANGIVLDGAVTGATGVSLNAGGTIALNSTVTGTNLQVMAGSGGNQAAIVAGAGNLLTGTDLTLRGASVGSAASRLNTDVDSIDAVTQNGGIFVTETDALSLNAMAGPGGTLDVRTLNGALTVASAVGDGVTLATAGDGNGITLNGGGFGGVQGRADAVSITTAGAGANIVLNDAVSGNQLTLTTGAGGDILLNSVIGASTGATITAGTAADRGDVVAAPLANISGDAVTITAATIGSSGARVHTAADVLTTTSTAGGTYITNQGGLTLASNASGGAVDVATIDGALTVNAASGTSIALTAGGVGSGIALNSSINTAGDLTLAAGPANGGAITVAPGVQISANALTVTGSAIGSALARLNTTVASLNATSTGGGIYVTESDGLTAAANATGGAVDVQTSNGALVVTSATGTGVTLVAGGAGNGLTLNGAVNGGAGDVTLTAGTQASRGAIVAGAGSFVTGNNLTATGSVIGSSGSALNGNITTLTASASNGGVYINEQNGLTLANVTASGAAGDIAITSAAGDITVGTVTASRDARLVASSGAILDDGDDTTRLTSTALNLSGRSIGSPSTLAGGTLDSSSRLDISASTLTAFAGNGGVFIDELDGLLNVNIEAAGGAAGDIELLTATGDLNLQVVSASDTLLLSAGHNIFARPGASPITARVAELRAGSADSTAGRIGTQSQLLEFNLSAGNSLRLFVPQSIDPQDATRAPATLPSAGVNTTLSQFVSPDPRATSAGYAQYQSVSDSPFTSAAESLVRTVQNQTVTVQSVLGLDWASFDANVSLFGTLEPAVCLPADQRDEEEGGAGC